MRHFERQIEKIKKLLLSLSAMVEERLHESIMSVQNRDVDQAQQVIDGDKRIDELEIEVEEECLHALALHQPVAFDLRFLVSVLKINSDLERIGDLAVHVAEQGRFLASEGRVEQMPFDYTTMTGHVEWMLRTSLDALVNVDPEKASAVRARDDEVDEIHRNMYDRVAEHLRANPDHAEQMIHLLNVSRQLERIADHACNIAKDVLYLAEGEIVRHRRAATETNPAEPSQHNGNHS